MKYKIYLKNKVISDKRITNYGLAVYISIRHIINNADTKYYINYDMISYNLCGTVSPSRYIMNGVKEGINNLIDMGLVSIVNKFSNCSYEVDLSKCFSEENDYFSLVFDNEIKGIMNLGTKADKFSLLNYFVHLIGTFDMSKGVYDDIEYCKYKTGIIGYMTIDYLARLSGFGKNTTQVKRYNKILEDNQLIYIYRHTEYIDKNGDFKSLPNVYGRYCDKSNIIKYADQFSNSKGIEPNSVKVSKAVTNNRRSLGAKYNFLYNGFAYSEEEIKEIYDYVHGNNKKYNTEINKKLEQNYISSSDKDYIDKLEAKMKDESVFNKYFFLFEKESAESGNGDILCDAED